MSLALNSSNDNLAAIFVVNCNTRNSRMKHPMHEYKNKVRFARKVHTFWEYNIKNAMSI